MFRTLPQKMLKPRLKVAVKLRWRSCCWMLTTTTVAVFLLVGHTGANGQSITEIIKDDHLEGPHVCKEVENSTVTITIPREEAYQERYQKWCLGIPPRCSAYRIKIRTVNETTTIIKQQIVKKCCVGYTLSEDGMRCVPECKAGCRHGQCVEPDYCRCEQGYAGKTCNIQCPPNLWGSDCSQRCKCTNNSTCNAADGSCWCPRGFKGQYCEETCASDRFGQDCAERCQCHNGGKCDHVSGECYCAAGFTGPLCTESCPAGTHGAQCQSKCRCQNGGTCDPVTGECICPAGYTGTVCANRCQPGRYGLKCAERCECFNGADCDRVTGVCSCAPGFMGSKCLDSCPHNRYGIDCSEMCRCQNGATCDTSDGRCTCADGWTGADCGQRLCPAKRFGANCTEQCECDWNNTKMCHPWTGKCLCQPGWSNSACDRPCRFLRYGQDCQLPCKCKNSSPCSHIDGTCLCIAGFKGDSCEEPCANNTYGQNCSERCQCMNGATCEGDSGKCLCAPGWQGIKCDRPCDAQHFGPDCREQCRCGNAGVCNPVNGQCSCPAGWTGELCEQKCSSGRFGQNCGQVCDCHLENTLVCNATTGRCICKADWGGIRCESRCPLGYYGENCNEICTCHNNSSCDPTTGDCICSRGWFGPTCSDPCPAGYFGHGCLEKCPGASDTGSSSSKSNRTCNPITGKYSCPPGYIGPTCEHPCSSGFFGQDCLQTCSCKNGGECSHVTGKCQCPPGWTGTRCEKACEDMYYGTNCSQRCNCHNNAKCRKNDGNCNCEAGWMGHRCDEVCPDGFYGNHCMKTCECPPGNFVCHAAKGCVCSTGYTGKNCDERMTNRFVQERVDEEDELTTGGFSDTEITGRNGPIVYNISIVLMNTTASDHHELQQSLDHTVDPVAALFNVTIVFPLRGNRFMLVYNQTHSLRPGHQVTLVYRKNGFLDVTLVRATAYVTMLTDVTDVMETFINTTSYAFRPAAESSAAPTQDDHVAVNLSYVNLQSSNDDRGSAVRTMELHQGQKIVIRLIKGTPNEDDPGNETIERSTPVDDAQTVTPFERTEVTELASDNVTASNESSTDTTTADYRESSEDHLIDESHSVTGASSMSEFTTERSIDTSLPSELGGFRTSDSPNDIPAWKITTEEVVHSISPEESDPTEGLVTVTIVNAGGPFGEEHHDEDTTLLTVADVTTESAIDSTVAAERLVDFDRRFAGNIGTVWTIVLMVLFATVVLIIMLYYRRRVANLRAEVNHVVNYMTQEQPSHFDNPVYARTGPGPSANGSCMTAVPPLDARTGLLRGVLPNNLCSVLTTGRRHTPNHDKYSYPDNNEHSTDKSYSIHYYPDQSLKNLEADLTNPNYYKDHVYDEIGLKDSMADTEYDHLDYSRAGSSHKAHYFHMPDEGAVGGLPLVPNGNIAAGGASAGGPLMTPGGSPKPINVIINNLSAPRHMQASANQAAPSSSSSSAAMVVTGNDLSSSSNSSPTPPGSPPPLPHHRHRNHHEHDRTSGGSSSSTSTTATLHLVPEVGTDDGGSIYVPMLGNSGAGGGLGAEPGTSPSTSSSSSSGAGTKIPDHQLNIKE